MDNLFTTNEIINYIDLAKREKKPRIRSVQSFLIMVLEINISKSITSDRIKSNKELHQGKKLLTLILDAEERLSTDRIIKNIHKNLRSDSAVRLLNERLRNDIKDAVNITPPAKKAEILNQKDFSALLYYAFKETLLNQKTDSDIYGYLYINGSDLYEHSEYKFKQLKKELDNIEGVNRLNNAVLNKYASCLTNISDSIYTDIQKKEKRFHASSIDSMILTLGADYGLNTTGISDNEKKSMSEYLALSENLFIVGEGGIGKTTLLINELNRIKRSAAPEYIPIFITLNRLSRNDISPSRSYIFTDLLLHIRELIDIGMFKQEFDASKIENDLIRLFEMKDSDKKILLMLDGYNEISSVAGVSSRDAIKKEIVRISSYNNVRIILTSREFFKHEDEFTSFRHIYACGIDDQTLDDYLDIKGISVSNDDSVYEIIHNPLFLLMYITNRNNGIMDASTRGAILYEFCNGTSSHYTELNRIKDPQFIDEPLPSFTPLLFDFVMPAIAAIMEMNDRFYISDSDIKENIISKLEDIIEPFNNSTDKYFSKYDSRHSMLILADELIKCTVPITEILVDEFAFLQQDSYGNLYFVHQYIKDYFATLFRLFTFHQSNWQEGSLYHQYLHSLMDIDTFDLTHEVALRSGLCDLVRVKKVLSSCRGEKDAFFINNLLSMLTAFNNGNLTDLTFRDIDFSNVNMTKHVFSDGMNNAATFVNCKFSDNSFFTYDSQQMLSTLTTYHGIPAVCEAFFQDSIVILRIQKYDTTSILFSDTLDFCFHDKPADLHHINKMCLSCDNKYLLFYDSSDHSNEFYTYSLETGRLNQHILDVYPVSSKTAFLSVKGKLIFHINNREMAVYEFLTPNNMDVSSSDYDDIKLVDIYLIPISYIENIYYYNNRYIIHCLSSLPEQLICTYDPDTQDFSSIPFKSIYITNSLSIMPSCFNDHLVFFAFGSSIFMCDLDLSEVKKIITIQTYNDYIALTYSSGKLHALTSAYIYDISLTDGNIENAFYIGMTHPEVTSCAVDSNYILMNNMRGDQYSVALYRFDTRDLHTLAFDRYSQIEQVQPLSNDRIIIMYNNSYMAIVSKDDLSLKDVSMFPKASNFLSVSYNESKELLAIVTDTLDNPLDRPASVFVIDTSYNDAYEMEVINTIPQCYYESIVCFSLDGNYLLHADMGTVKVYDTATFRKVKEFEYGHKITCMKSYEDYILVVYNTGHEAGHNIYYSEKICLKEIIYSYDNSIINNRALIPYNTIVLKTSPYESDIKDRSLLFEENPMKCNTIAFELAPYIYRSSYRSEQSNEEYISMYCCENGESEYYFQDDILIHCSDQDYKRSNNKYSLKDVSTDYAFIDKKNLSYYCMHDNEFIKVDLNTFERTYLQLIPHLYINKCIFRFKDEPPQYIKNIISYNLGIIN